MSIPWRRFVAVGDSMTEGVGDPVRGGGLRGWADRLAESLRAADDSLIYVNLAKRGLKTAEVRETQLRAAMDLEPDLASVLVGMNDLLDPGFDHSRYGEEFDSMVKPLTESGTLVLTATFPDITTFSPLPKRFTAGIQARLHAASDVVREVSERRGTLMLDEDALPAPLEREILSVDRLHPSPRGHVLIAQLFVRALEEHSGVRIPQPKEENLAGKLTQARWLLRQFDVSEVARFFKRFYALPGKRRAS
ncbi:MAG: SGNH/GDSL hydrolase family protein [Actinomycetota bacterium]